MSNPRSPTLEQIRVFLAVLKEGSFSAAAKKLNRAPSVISYTIASLESQLELVLFDRKSTKKPVLTAHGRAVFADLRDLSSGVDDLITKAQGLISGLEAEITLVADVMFPMEWLVQLLEEFQEAFPKVLLRLNLAALGSVAQEIIDGTANVGIGCTVEGLYSLNIHRVAGIRMIAVAAPHHPLGKVKGEISHSTARKHMQLVLTDRSNLTHGYNFSVISSCTMRLTDLNAKHALLLSGLGWGGMPASKVEQDIKEGKLVKLDIDAWKHNYYNFETINSSDKAQGPAAQWLINRLRNTKWNGI